MFGTGLGSYKLTIFKELKIGELFGEFFIIGALLLNGIILLNFIIAILADTYSKLSR